MNDTTNRTKNIIAEAYLRLLEKHKNEKIPISEILLEAEIAKGTFYRYFKDKEELNAYVISYISNEIFDRFNSFIHAKELKEKNLFPMFINSFKGKFNTLFYLGNENKIDYLLLSEIKNNDEYISLDLLLDIFSLLKKNEDTNLEEIKQIINNHLKKVEEETKILKVK